LSLLAALAVSHAAQAVGWRNVDAEHYLGGRKSSAGYLQGKVVLVCRWETSDDACRQTLVRLQDLWESFKNKQLVILGAPVGGVAKADTVKTLLATGKTTFPVYADAGLAAGEPLLREMPYFYVADETGKVAYQGRDDRTATQVLVTALTDFDSPKDVAQWKRFIDYELTNLPCHAYLRLKAFNKKYPNEAKAYLAKVKELIKDPDVKKVADLVEFAKRAKDPPRFGPKEKARRAKYEKLVNDVVDKCAPMKEASDPRVAQEAKNALADLKWAQANF